MLSLAAHLLSCGTTWPGLSCGVALFRQASKGIWHAGPQFNERGVVMHGGGTLVWADGRRAQLDCGFLRNLVQTVQVNPATAAQALDGTYLSSCRGTPGLHSFPECLD